MSIPLTATPGTARRLLAYAIEVHPPALYALIALAWSWSVMGSMVLASPPPPMLTTADWLPTAGRVSLIFFLMLLYLRALDEIKDLDYDRQHNPTRPLVRGSASVADSWGLAALSGAGVLGLALSLSPWVAAWTLLNMAYGVGLLVLERHWALFRQNLLLNLALTFPVSAGLNVLAWLALMPSGLAPNGWAAVMVGLMHVAIFLHMEFGRKLKWPHWCAPDDTSYTLVLGPKGAAAVCFGLLLAALTASTVLHWNAQGSLWSALPWLAAVPSWLGWRRWQSARQQHAELKPYFGGAMIAFFVLNTLVTARTLLQ
jgi:4-hydroxybenzoate polyprenyltransferase